MQYNGRYKIFDPSCIETYPVGKRENKVKLADMADVDRILDTNFDVTDPISEAVHNVAADILECRKEQKPVILFAGAHLIKNGLGPLVIELLRRRMVTLIAGNGATSIHDFELALIGETSEYVPQTLRSGQFGMAYEFCYHNLAVQLGNKYKLGYGESLGKMICDESFRNEVLAVAAESDSPRQFSHPELSVLAACYENRIPFTVHIGIGADVTNQHSSFDGQAAGGCSARDFLIYTDEVAKLTDGGVVLNISSAVTGPEVLLKAVSMASNARKAPRNITTADFDLRDYTPAHMTNESAQGYYFRDQKSVVTRVPEAFNGRGFYIQGDQRITMPLLYKAIITEI